MPLHAVRSRCFENKDDLFSMFSATFAVKELSYIRVTLTDHYA
jgi:hypothetical protein